MKSAPPVDGHPELPLVRRPAPATVSIEIVRAQKTIEAVVTLAIQVTGLEPGEVAIACGIDKGHFSRVRSGEAHFPLNKIARFCEIVGNTIVPEWIAYQVGHGLVMLKSEAERRAEQAEHALAESQRENALLRNLIQGRATA